MQESGRERGVGRPDHPSDRARTLGRLRTLLDYGQVLYEAYRESGRPKSRARLLRENNARTVRLLIDEAHLLEEPLRGAALELLHHSDVFVNQWDAHDRDHEIGEVEEFAYPTDVGFPTRAAALLREAAGSGPRAP